MECTCCIPYSPYSDPTARVTRVEPKVYLANERTFINWLTMAVKIGSVASALAAFGAGEDESESYKSAIRNISSFLAISAICLCIYCMYTFFWRRRMIRSGKDRGIDDPYGPLVLATVMLVALGSVFVSALTKLGVNTYFQETYLQ